MYITELYKEVFEKFGNDDAEFLKDLWWEEGNDFADVIEFGENIVEHKSSYQDMIFKMKSDGRIFRYTLLRDNSGYWGDGETYWDDTDVEEVEQKEIVITQWVRVEKGE